MYGYFAGIIAKQFFPMHDEWLSTLLAIATFGISFLMRPIGAVVLGIYGGRIRVMLGTSVLMGLLIYPMFALLQSHPAVGRLLLLQGTAGILKAAYSGPMPALMAEIFPTEVRSTGLSIGYSIGVTIFGGFAPTIVETLVHLTGDKLAPSYYVLIAAVLSGLPLVAVAWRRSHPRSRETVPHPSRVPCCGAGGAASAPLR